MHSGRATLAALKVIEDRSTELQTLSGEVVQAWQDGMPHLSPEELVLLFEDHGAIGRDLLMMAAILLAEMWIDPRALGEFASTQAHMDTVEDLVSNALCACENAADKKAEAK